MNKKQYTRQHRETNHESPLQSSQIARSSANPEATPPLHPILQMQKTVGNAQTTRHLQRAETPDAAAATAPPGNAAYNTNIQRNAPMVAPEEQALLDPLVPIARQAIQEFRDFRNGGYNTAEDDLKVQQPARALAAACNQANSQLVQIQHQRDTGGLGGADADNWLTQGVTDILGKAHSGLSTLKVATYLQQQFDTEELTVLQQALGFSNVPHSPAAAKLFGIQVSPVIHDYNLTLRTAKSWVTTPHEVTVEYSNNIGMHYTHYVDFRWLGGGASLVTGLAKNVKENLTEAGKAAVNKTIDTTLGIDEDFEETKSAKPNAGQFWLPHWFENSSMTEFAAYAKGKYEHVLAGGELASSFAGVDILNFTYGSKKLSFDLTQESSLFKLDPKLPELRSETFFKLKEAFEEVTSGELDETPKLVKGEFDAEWDISYKYAVRKKGYEPVTGADPVIPNPDVRGGGELPTSEWQPLATAELYFDTGSALPNGVGEQALYAALGRVQEYMQKDPNAQLKFIVLGRSSKIWKHLKQGETVSENNMNLSQERAQNTLFILQQLRTQLLGELEATQSQNWSDRSVGLGMDLKPRWISAADYITVPSATRKNKAKDDNSPTERGAALRIAVKPTPIQTDPDAGLEAKMNQPTLVESLANNILDRLLGTAGKN